MIFFNIPRKGVRAIIAFCSAVGIMICGLTMTWLQVLYSDLSEASNAAEKAVNNINIILNEASHGADSARPFLKLSCSQEVSQSLNRLAINLPHIRIITLIHEGWMSCSSLSTPPYKIDFSSYVDHKLKLSPSTAVSATLPIIILLQSYPEGTISVSLDASYVNDNLTLLSTHRTLLFQVGDHLLTENNGARFFDRNMLDAQIIVTSALYPFSVIYSGNRVLPMALFLAKGKYLIGLFVILSLLSAFVIWRYAFRVMSPYKTLESAIFQGEIIPFYQPVVDQKTGRIAGAEVLARWKLPSGIFISPDAFIPLAEQSGLIVPMTSSLMIQVAKDLVPVSNRLVHPFHISVNISTAHMNYPNFVNDCKILVSSFPKGSIHFVVEITEREPFESLSKLKDILTSLRNNGISVALDDFGTGYSNFSYLNELPIDFIKIDRTFVSRITPESDSTKLIDCVISMAEKLNLDIVAEGIETAFQANYLARKGVPYFQGYYFSKPLSRSDFIRHVILEGVRHHT
ncbi:EAL domain-containing protein [Hafnia alvei]|uniref:cyclic-guanylate-specific phosphodiesterase n=1 Tax=Hafnia alvei TaxID=569 RepID=A0ABD7Q8V2_HAFAL|nr:EAL domain-containing protein [Hafnia alvei]TBL69148.1 EAL domain-containing protein [Hafnia alvei]